MVATLITLPVVALGWVVLAAKLAQRVRIEWIPTGRFGVFVYSHGREWRSYVEAEIVPRLRDRLVIVDRSADPRWRGQAGLAGDVYAHWSFGRGPLAVVFVPWWRPRRFAFRPALRAYAAGDPAPVEALTARLLRLLGRPGTEAGPSRG